jgi:hypothetical protein
MCIFIDVMSSQSERKRNSSDKDDINDGEYSPNHGKSVKTVIERNETDDGDDDDNDSGDDANKSESVLFERTVLLDTKKKSVYLCIHGYKYMYIINGFKAAFIRPYENMYTYMNTSYRSYLSEVGSVCFKCMHVENRFCDTPFCNQ